MSPADAGPGAVEGDNKGMHVRREQLHQRRKSDVKLSTGDRLH